MILIGLDDTDTLETPGTNKLAQHLVELLDDRYKSRWIVRHQLLEDPRVPCTYRNGCVSLAIDPIGEHSIESLVEEIRNVMLDWCPAGSDPGLCVVTERPERFIDWGRTAQTRLVEQSAALEIARTEHVFLEPLGGSGDGVVGALAAVGLLSTWNSGRVIHSDRIAAGAFAMAGFTTAADLYAAGVDDIVSLDGNNRVTAGDIDLGKRLRPNLRDGRIVLHVSRNNNGWEAQRVVA